MMNSALTYSILQQKRKKTAPVLGFEPYVAPDGFDRTAQPVDIYDVFCKYYLINGTAKWIYSVKDTATSTKPTGGTSYHYGYDSGGTAYEADLASGGTITWVAGSTERYVIVNHTTMSMMKCTIDQAQNAEWIYAGNYVNGIYTYWATTLKYIHIHRLDNITTYYYQGHRSSGLTGNLYISHSATYIGEDLFGNGNVYGLVFMGCGNLSGTLIIPDNITNIGWQSFQGDAGFTGLSLGSGLLKIWYSAFSGCTNMTGPLGLPSSLTAIQYQAFYDTKFTDDLNIPASCVTIDYSNFYGCDFSSITSSSSTVIVDDDVIYDIYTSGQVKAIHGRKSNSSSLTIRNDCTRIMSYCFAYNKRTGSVEIPNTVTSIDDYAFYVFSSATGTLTFEATSVCASFGLRTFQSTKFTGPLSIPNSVTSIDGYCFLYSTGFESLTLGTGLTTIPLQAFNNMTGLKGNLVITDNITYIGNSAFNGFSSMTGSLTIGSAVQTIEDNGFGNNVFTGGLNIPASVTTLKIGCFGIYHNFSSITSSSTNYPASDNVLYDVKTAGQVIAHISAKDYSGTLTLRSDTTRIYTYCFYKNKRTGVLTIPDSVSTIDGYAFQYCTGFNDAANIGTSSSSVSALNSNTFTQCPNITRWNIYRSTAPTISGTVFGSYAKPLHVPSGSSSYTTAPWTTTAIFSSITKDL